MVLMHSAHSVSRHFDVSIHGFSLRQSRSFQRLAICNSSQSSQTQSSITLIPPLNQSVVAIILGDGPEAKLHPLTKRRSEAAIPIGARYRLIDIVISNCINSDINKIYTLTQTNSTSLNCHVSRAYSTIGLGKEGFIDVLAACQNLEDDGWFKGNADAVRKWLSLLEKHPAMEFLILPGHHLYTMDYRKFLKTHRDSRADITVSVSSAQRNSSSSSYGFLILDKENQVLERKEEPIGDNGGRNMGIYVFKKDSLIKILKEYLPKANDFGNEVIKEAILMGMKVQAHMFDGKWEDMNSIESFYHANMEINFNISPDFPIYTMPLCLPPTQISNATIRQSIIADGCIINRCNISNSIIGMRTFIADGAVIEDSLFMGSDFYQTDLPLKREKEKGSCIPIGIGERTIIRKAIIDKNACIGKNVKICNSNGVQECEREAEGYIISGGIVTVLKNAVIPDNSII